MKKLLLSFLLSTCVSTPLLAANPVPFFVVVGTAPGTIAAGNDSRFTVPAITGGTIDGATLGATTAIPSIRGRTFVSPSTWSLSSSNVAPWINSVTTVSGSTTGNPAPHNNISITDTVNSSTTSSDIDAFRIALTTGAGAGGWRSALYSALTYGTTSTNSTLANTLYTAITGIVRATANANGATTTGYNGSHTALIGKFWGSNVNSSGGAGATNLSSIIGQEIDVAIETGASAGFKTGLLIAQTTLDAVRGLDTDSAISIVNSTSTTAGWKSGISFGTNNGEWPFKSDSVLIDAPTDILTVGPHTAPLASRGIDFSKVQFGSTVFSSPGFSVDNLGNAYIANGTISAVSSGIQVDVPSKVVTAIAINTAGSGYAVGNTFFGSNGDIYTVTTVNGSGAITGISITNPGYAVSPPTNPVTMTANSIVSGTGANFNLTWSTQSTLSLNPSGNITLGKNTSDRGRTGNSECLASGDFSVIGDAQQCSFVLRGITTTTAAARLTTDGNTASTGNCVNIPDNLTANIRISLSANDVTTAANSFVWSLPLGILTRDTGVGTTALTIGTPVSLSTGTVTGAAVAATADTTNGCINLSYTPPTGNTDIWHAVAEIKAVETQ